MVTLSPHLNYHNILNHLDFLRQIDRNGENVFYNVNVIKDAVRRYEIFWIRLIQQVSNGPEQDLDFAPPLGNLHRKDIVTLEKFVFPFRRLLGLALSYAESCALPK